MLTNRAEETRRTIYLNIKEGNFVANIQGKQCLFSDVSGMIEKVYTKDREFNGRKVVYIYLDIADNEEVYKLGIPFDNGMARTILNCLASAKDLKKNKVEIHPYMQDGKGKAVVREAGEKLDWRLKIERGVSSENLYLITTQLLGAVKAMVEGNM